MRNIYILLLILPFAFFFQNCGSGFQTLSVDKMSMNGEMDMAVPDESRVMLDLKGEQSRTAGDVSLEFDLMDMKSNKMVSNSDLAITNEKKLHFIIFDSALKEFQHVHPQFMQGTNGNDGMWMVTAKLTANGEYFLFAEGTLAADNQDFLSSRPRGITITGGTPTNTTPPQLNDSRVATVSNSVVTLSNGMLMAKEANQMMIKFSRNDGSQPILSDYLGSRAHVIVAPSDASTLIHAHAMPISPNELSLHILFPKPGGYRVWIQFIDGGVLKRAELEVQVM